MRLQVVLQRRRQLSAFVLALIQNEWTVIRGKWTDEKRWAIHW
jgi:hypothetical protein